MIIALALLCGCKGKLDVNHQDKSDDSVFFTDPELQKYNILGIRIVKLTIPEKDRKKQPAWEDRSVNFVIGEVPNTADDFLAIDVYLSSWEGFPKIYMQDVDNDGKKELIFLARRWKDDAQGVMIMNIYRYFPESESDEPSFLAIDEPIEFAGDYEFKDGKLIITNRGWSGPLPDLVYRIERYKIVMESEGWDWRRSNLFLRSPPRKESEWLKMNEEKLKKKFNAYIKKENGKEE